MRQTLDVTWAITREKVEAVIRQIITAGHPRKIFLFGSYVRGETNRDSDLDVLVVTDDKIETRTQSQPAFAAILLM